MKKPNSVVLARVQPLMNQINLKHDNTEHGEYLSAVAAIGGTEPSDVAKKLSLLKQRGQITSAEIRIMLAEHYRLKLN